MGLNATNISKEVHQLHVAELAFHTNKEHLLSCVKSPQAQIESIAYFAQREKVVQLASLPFEFQTGNQSEQYKTYSALLKFAFFSHLASLNASLLLTNTITSEEASTIMSQLSESWNNLKAACNIG